MMPPKKNTRAGCPPDDDAARVALATKKDKVAFADEIPPTNDQKITIVLEGEDNTTNQKRIPSPDLEVQTSSSDTIRDPPPNPKPTLSRHNMARLNKIHVIKPLSYEASSSRQPLLRMPFLDEDEDLMEGEDLGINTGRPVEAT
jgi:hypothetical protein